MLDDTEPAGMLWRFAEQLSEVCCASVRVCTECCMSPLTATPRKGAMTLRTAHGRLARVLCIAECL